MESIKKFAHILILGGRSKVITSNHTQNGWQALSLKSNPTQETSPLASWQRAAILQPNHSCSSQADNLRQHQGNAESSPSFRCVSGNARLSRSSQPIGWNPPFSSAPRNKCSKSFISVVDVMVCALCRLTWKVELHRACDHQCLEAAGTIHCRVLPPGVSSNTLLDRTRLAICLVRR